MIFLFFVELFFGRTGLFVMAGILAVVTVRNVYMQSLIGIQLTVISTYVHWRIPGDWRKTARTSLQDCGPTVFSAGFAIGAFQVPQAIIHIIRNPSGCLPESMDAER